MTIYDIAKLAGVSASTVSRVVNGKAGVGEKKRREILALLEDSNYTPDMRARNLATQNTHTIGILMDDIASIRQNDGLSRAANEIMKNGYYCFSKYIGMEPDAMEEGVRSLAENKVAGVLLLGVSFTRHDLLRVLIERYLRNIPVVLVHQTERIEMDNVYCIGASERKGFERCVRRLVDRGRRHIVLFIDKGRFSRERIRTYFETELARHPQAEGWTYMDVEPTVDGGLACMQRVFAEHPEVDAVLSAQDGIAIGAMYASMDRGLSVPEDISVIGEDNSMMCEACRPRLSSLDTMLTETSPMAARMLVDLLRGDKCARKVVLEMELVERGTI